MSAATVHDALQASVAIERRKDEQFTTAPATSLSMMQLAIEKGASLDQLDRLMAMQDRFEATQARKAYVEAMADFKKESIVVTKDKDNGQYKSKYTSIGNLVNTVTPFLSKHGLSAEWHLDQSNGIKVGCTITHSLGHSGETKWMIVPLDKSGAKNPLQELKSSITYAKISTFEMACGLASKDANLDDDGNGSGKAALIRLSDEDIAYHKEQIEAATNFDTLKKAFAAGYNAAKAIKDESSQAQLTKVYEAQKVALR